MSASIRQTVHKNVTIFTGINAEKTATQVKYCHQQLIADAFLHSRETLCSVKRIMIHYLLSLKKRNLKQKNQLGKNLLPQPKLKALLTMEERQPLHLMSKLTLERNLMNFRRKVLLMSQLLKKRMPQLSQLQVKKSLLMIPLLKKRMPQLSQLQVKRSLLMIPLSKMRMLVLNQLKSLLKNLQLHNFQVGYLKEISTIMEFQMSLKAQ